MMGVQRLAGYAAAALCLLLPAAQTAHAQRPPTSHVFFGATVAAYRTGHPEGAPLAIGGLVGVERALAERFALRAAATLMRAVVQFDGVSICYPLPSGGCLPDAVFPRWLSQFEVQGAFMPLRDARFQVTGGVGVALASDPREYRERAPKLLVESLTRFQWRGGVDLRLGTGPRAPRLQVSRTGFVSGPFSLTFVDAVAIVVRP